MSSWSRRIRVDSCLALITHQMVGFFTEGGSCWKKVQAFFLF